MTDLKHYGRLGMKWGRRKAQDRGGSRISIIGSKIKNSIKARVTNAHISKEDLAKANQILNNPKSKISDIEWALKTSGVNPKTGKSLTYKSSDKHIIDGIISLKEKNYKKAASDLYKGVGKLAIEAAVGFTIGYGLAAVSQEILK